MSGRPFRFIHASDFHLEMPPGGIGEVPDHLRELFVDAAYSAAAQVFDTGLAEGADFLVLSGDILQPQAAGLRGPLFLVEQFTRLADRGIPVYWAGGQVDPQEAWPAAFVLPDNVHVFPRGRGAEFVCQREGTPLARVIGTSREGGASLQPDQFGPDPAERFSIAVAHGEAEAAALASAKIDYWALGGRHDRAEPTSASPAVHYPGSPQGRSPAEAGVHGCTLVQVDEQGQVRASLVPTDVLRWLTQRIVVGPTTTPADLEPLFRQAVQTLLGSGPKIDLMVSWSVSGSGPALAQLRRGLAAEVLGWLRTEFGSGRPAVWSVALEVESPAGLPAEWFEQETIRGDFLRAVAQLEMNPDEPLDLGSYIGEAALPAAVAEAIAKPDKAARQQVLRDAASLGADLLSGEGP
jgi:DNA repair protein SbcD/Mre11